MRNSTILSSLIAIGLAFSPMADACLHNFEPLAPAQTTIIYKKLDDMLVSNTMISGEILKGKNPVKIFLTRAKAKDVKARAATEADLQRFEVYEKDSQPPKLNTKGTRSIAPAVESEKIEFSIGDTGWSLKGDLLGQDKIGSFKDFIGVMTSKGVYGDDPSLGQVQHMYNIIKGALDPRFGYRLAILEMAKEHGKKLESSKFSAVLEVKEPIQNGKLNYQGKEDPEGYGALGNFYESAIVSSYINIAISTHTPSIIIGIEGVNSAVVNPVDIVADMYWSMRSRNGDTYVPLGIKNPKGDYLEFINGKIHSSKKGENLWETLYSDLRLTSKTAILGQKSISQGELKDSSGFYFRYNRLNF